MPTSSEDMKCTIDLQDRFGFIFNLVAVKENEIISSKVEVRNESISL
jgi:hypothetical protein